MSRMRRKVSVTAFAKVNLGLEVLGRRPDGFHELASIMQCVTIADTVRLARAARGIRLSVRGAGRGIPAGPKNLCWRAARMFLDETGFSGGVRITLTKRVPSGAGLGGGSSDAAAVLTGMDRLFGTRVGKRRLARMAARLGSDVPFFLRGPTALCLGRGEIIRPFSLGKELWMVLAKPSLSLPTPAVYAALRAPPLSGGGIRLRTLRMRSTLIRGALRRGDIMGLVRRLRNDLEPAAMVVAPRIARFKDRFASLTPHGAWMTGSGSAFFAIVPDARFARHLAAAFRRTGPGKAWAVRSVGPRDYGRVDFA